MGFQSNYLAVEKDRAEHRLEIARLHGSENDMWARAVLICTSSKANN